MKQDVLQALLAHAKYSFSEIGWDFQSLTRKEQSLIKSQGILDEIKGLAEETESTADERSGQQSVEPFDDWLPNDPRNW